MKKQVWYIFLWMVIGLSPLEFLPSTVHAEQASVMPFPFPQRFSPSDASGDTGAYNCMAAAVIMTLKTVAVEHDGKLEVPHLTYTDLRQEVRKKVAPTQGIPPMVLADTINSLTTGVVSLHMVQLNGITWESYLTQELQRGYPIIVHMSDREVLFGKEHVSDSSHVIVIYGIDQNSVYFSDSWDGKTHKVHKSDFARSWAAGAYPWWAFPVRVHPQRVVNTT